MRVLPPFIVLLLLGCPGPWGKLVSQESEEPLEEARDQSDGGGEVDGVQSLRARISPPTGYERLQSEDGSFGGWLRQLPLRPGRPVVRLYNGLPKLNQRAHYAILDVDVGDRDLQQCADAVMRLRAEYLFTGSCADEIRFDFTSGDPARWSEWREGKRPRVSGNSVTWNDGAGPDHSYSNFRRYLETVFTYAGSASLERELVPVSDPSKVEPGDVFIQGGFPGHAVLVMDVARSSAGDRVFLLAQSYMPAQDIHILRSRDDLSPWYRAQSSGELQTPEWVFDHRDLRRFPSTACEGEGPR